MVDTSNAVQSKKYFQSRLHSDYLFDLYIASALVKEDVGILIKRRCCGKIFTKHYCVNSSLQNKMHYMILFMPLY